MLFRARLTCWENGRLIEVRGFAATPRVYSDETKHVPHARDKAVHVEVEMARNHHAAATEATSSSQSTFSTSFQTISGNEQECRKTVARMLFCIPCAYASQPILKHMMSNTKSDDRPRK